MIEIAVDRDAEIPIGVQLAWALRARIRDGYLKPGQRLPGLRDLAEATGVNVNTVRSVYQRLEHEGLIDSQQGSGTFVACVSARPSALAAIVADAVREANESGVDPREVAAALYVSPTAAAQPQSDAAERRRLLREQIAMLERTLGELEAKHPGIAVAAEQRRGGIGPALLDEGELEHVRATLVRRLSTVQAAIDDLAGELRTTAERAKRSERAKRNDPARTAAERNDGAASSERDSISRRAGRPRSGRSNPAPAGA
jgi:GntR family transcriptional regulator